MLSTAEGFLDGDNTCRIDVKFIHRILEFTELVSVLLGSLPQALHRVIPCGGVQLEKIHIGLHSRQLISHC